MHFSIFTFNSFAFRKSDDPLAYMQIVFLEKVAYNADTSPPGRTMESDVQSNNILLQGEIRMVQTSATLRPIGKGKPTSAPKALRFKRLWHNNKYLWLLFLPCLIYYLVFRYAPMFGLVITFKDYNLFKGVWASCNHSFIIVFCRAVTPFLLVEVVVRAVSRFEIHRHVCGALILVFPVTDRQRIRVRILAFSVLSMAYSSS